MRTYSIIIFLITSFNLFAQTGSEIYLLDLKMKKGKITLSNAQNITKHLGYDNQPSFHKSEPILYLTSFNDDGRADLKSYFYKKGEIKKITNTTTREYSPTLTPDGKHLSCIIQRDNRAQDLGMYPLNGGEAIVLIDNLIVGYHAWINARQLALFVLGKDGSANTLRLYNIDTKKDTILQENIGRSLHKVSGKNAFSYVLKKPDAPWEVMIYDLENGKNTFYANTLPGREDIAWTNNGVLISSDGKKIFAWLNKTWTEVQIEGDTSFLKEITRIAVNNAGNKLAVVVAE